MRTIIKLLILNLLILSSFAGGDGEGGGGGGPRINPNGRILQKIEIKLDIIKEIEFNNGFFWSPSETTEVLLNEELIGNTFTGGKISIRKDLSNIKKVTIKKGNFFSL